MLSRHNFIVAVFLVSCAFGGSPAKHVPDYLPICKRDQATINECGLAAVKKLLPKLVEGIPELDVPAIDPFYIKEIKTPAGAYARDIKVTGGSNVQIKSVTADLDTFTIRVRVRFPKLHMEGRYKLNARVLMLQVQGEGTVVGDAMKCDAELVMHSQLYQKDGKEHIRFLHLDADINMKDYRLHLDGLFNGDKTLEEITNQAINENRGEFLKITKPFLEMAVSMVLLDAANKVVDGISLDELLPKP